MLEVVSDRLNIVLNYKGARNWRGAHKNTQALIRINKASFITIVSMSILRSAILPRLSGALTISHIEEYLNNAQTRVKMGRAVNPYFLLSDKVKLQFFYKMQCKERKKW